MAERTEQVWREYHDRLYGFILSRVKDETVADDVLQEVFLRIHTRIDSLREESKLQSWIYQIARNTIIDHYRSHKRMEALPESLAAPESDESEQFRREVAQCMLPMVARLEEPYREAVALAELEGRTQEEVARAQGLSLSGAKSRVQRGRAKLKDMLLGCCRFEMDHRGSLAGYEDDEPGCDCKKPC